RRGSTDDAAPCALASSPVEVSAARPATADRRLMAVVLFGYVVAALGITWRLRGDPASRTVAGDPDGAGQLAWCMRYAASAVAHGRIPSLVTTALNAPQGVNFMWNSLMLLPCTLLAPVTLLAGPQVSLTLLTTIGFAGSASAMFVVLA